MKLTVNQVISVIVLMFLSITVYAESNGIWDYASDIRGGTFAADEMGVTTNFTFVHPVYFLDKIYVDGLEVSTLDSNGKVPLAQLPFHKGDLVSPADRPSISGQLNYDTDYFYLEQLQITGNTAKSVLEGVNFGPGRGITGAFSLDNVCTSAGGRAQCGVVEQLHIGDSYIQIGDNAPDSENYCEKISVTSTGIISSNIVLTAGSCKQISSCSTSAQTISNYPDGTTCALDSQCQAGICTYINIHRSVQSISYTNHCEGNCAYYSTKQGITQCTRSVQWCSNGNCYSNPTSMLRNYLGSSTITNVACHAISGDLRNHCGGQFIYMTSCTYDLH